jgi:hypothetical protein
MDEQFGTDRRLDFSEAEEFGPAVAGREIPLSTGLGMALLHTPPNLPCPAAHREVFPSNCLQNRSPPFVWSAGPLCRNSINYWALCSRIIASIFFLIASKLTRQSQPLPRAV